MKNVWTSQGAAATLIILLTFVAYIPALSCGFVWDDDELVVDNNLIKAPDGLYRFWCTTQPNTEIDKPRCLPFCFGFPLASITDDLAVHLGRVFLADGLQADIAGTTTPFYFGGPFRAIRPITPAITSTATARKAVGRKINCPLGCVRIINLYPEDLASDGQPAANHQSP